MSNCAVASSLVLQLIHAAFFVASWKDVLEPAFLFTTTEKRLFAAPLQWSMLKKAIFAEISLFAAVKSRFYSVPVSAFLFPAPTKLGFGQSAVSRETISKMATDFSAQCVIAILPSRWFPFSARPIPLPGFSKMAA